VTLSEIASDSGTTQDELRLRATGQLGGTNAEAQRLDENRRAFIVRSFAMGHDLGPISAYIDRPALFPLHALRMACIDTHGGNYGRSVSDMAVLLRETVA
jgi:hypothetical protein